MMWLRVVPAALRPEDLTAAADALRTGGIVAFPTETFYGLAVDPRSAPAVERVFALKGRSSGQALPLIAAGVEQVATQVGTLSPLARRLADRAWPGPLTLIIAASPALCEHVHRSTGKVAVRVTADPVARALAERAGHPITSTSANLSGETPAVTADAVARAFDDRLDVLIDAGRTPGGLPSTIVDATGDTPLLVRAGIVAWERVLEFSKSG